jgi:glutathione synthase/RimK-type ligase-like ATP-grasp enzyme
MVGLSTVALAAGLSRPGRCTSAPVAFTRSRSALILNGEALVTGDDDAGQPRIDGVRAVFRSIDDLAFTIETGRVCVRETVGGADLANFALVQVAAYRRPTGALLNAVAEYLRDKRVRAVNAGGVGAPTKLFQYVRFAQAGIPVPATTYLPARLLVDSYADLAHTLGLPFILKALSTSGGRLSFLIGNESDFVDRLHDPNHRNVLFLAQEFVPNNTTYRVLVLGNEAPVVIRRTSVGTTHLTNATRGERSDLIDRTTFDQVARRLAVRAASVMRYEVACVNLIQHWTNRNWYVLDVNPTPLIAAGAFASDKLEAYASYLERTLN